MDCKLASREILKNIQPIAFKSGKIINTGPEFCDFISKTIVFGFVFLVYKFFGKNKLF